LIDQDNDLVKFMVAKKIWAQYR